jgi:diketogulonate reductase-like aldo/keto reductase
MTSSRKVAMERRRFGSTGREAAVIGQGTWELEKAESTAAFATLRRGLDFGMTHIDTAEMYGSGAVEELIGAAIDDRRDEVFLVSKVLPNNASLKGTIAACERSLRRLRTDRLDCYLLHWRGSHPLEDTVAAFERLRADGKILSWGVSNFDVDDLAEVRRIAGEGHPSCNQVLYHLRERTIEQAVLPWCEQNGVAVVAYSPFGHKGGFPEPRSAGGRVLNDIADRRRATPRRVALRFLVRRPSVFAIPKASSPHHAEENAKAGALELSEADVARIDAAFPIDPRPRPLPML